MSGLGLDIVKTTVWSSGVVMFLIGANRPLTREPVLGVRMRSKFHFTSADVNGRPLWNLTFGCRLIVYVSWSAYTST